MAVTEVCRFLMGASTGLQSALVFAVTAGTRKFIREWAVNRNDALRHADLLRTLRVTWKRPHRRDKTAVAHLAFCVTAGFRFGRLTLRQVL